MLLSERFRNSLPSEKALDACPSVYAHLQFILTFLHHLLSFPIPAPNLFPSPSLHHTRDNLKRSLRRRKRRPLRHRIIRGRNLHNIRAHQIQLLHPAQNPDELARRPPTGLGCPRARRDAGIQHVDVETQIHGFVARQAHALNDRVDHAFDANVVDVIRVDAQEALLGTRVRVVAVCQTGESGAQTGVGRRSVRDQTLLTRGVEETSVVEPRLLAGPVRRVPQRVPGVQVRIEVQNGDWFLVDFVQRSQRRKRNAVVSSQRDELGLSCRNALDVRCGVGSRSCPELEERLVHLPLSKAIVKGSNGDVSAVNNLGPVQVRVYSCARVVACGRQLTGRSGADRAGSETGARTVGDCSVEGGADYGNVVEFRGFEEAFDVWEMRKCRDAGKSPLSVVSWVSIEE